nr:unnamed protein product [Spirometra erinaceieuropaei]
MKFASFQEARRWLESDHPFKQHDFLGQVEVYLMPLTKQEMSHKVEIVSISPILDFIAAITTATTTAAAAATAATATATTTTTTTTTITVSTFKDVFETKLLPEMEKIVHHYGGVPLVVSQNEPLKWRGVEPPGAIIINQWPNWEAYDRFNASDDRKKLNELCKSIGNGYEICAELEKNRQHKAYVNRPTDDNKAAFYRSRRLVQRWLQEMQDAWTARKAEEIQGYADRNEWKNFFSATKAVYGPPTKVTAPLLSANGSTLLTEKTQVLPQWAKHSKGVLNRPSTIFDAATARLLQVKTSVGHAAVLKRGGAGSDAIPAEIYKHSALRLTDFLSALFKKVWRREEVLQDFKDATIVHLYECKESRLICDNHRGISLLNIAGKIFTRVILKCLNHHLE